MPQEPPHDPDSRQFSRTWTRRSALKLGLGSLIGASAASNVVQTIDSKIAANLLKQTQFRSTGLFGSASLDRSLEETPNLSLQARAATKGLLYGAAASYEPLSRDPNLAKAHIQECGILVPENALKLSSLRPTLDSFDYQQADWLANFAHTHQQLFRGHTLVWNQALPDWFDQTVTAKTAEQFMVNHITTVMQHYAGQMHSWDVVNEAVAVPDTSRSDGLHPYPWLNLLGKDYIDLAFRTAAVADPDALLVYNDRWLDYDTPRDNSQRQAVLNLLAHLKSRGSPVQALGIQAHLNASETHFDAQRLRDFLADVAALGLKILITELDVEDKDLPADIPSRDSIVADAYAQYLSVVLDEPAVIAVLTWGLSDRYSWLAKYAARADALPVRPLPLDADYQPKPAWKAIANAFDHAPKRS
jgi:endo-1,4-beta-xylanase